MKINQRTFARAARIATRRAISFLALRDMPGESGRARMMQDSWQRHAEEILGQANCAAIEKASALKVCRQLTSAVKIAILQTEIKAAKGNA
jgi:hypothetical protein